MKTLASRRANGPLRPTGARQVQEVTPAQVGLRFGDSEWGRRFEGFGFTPALSFYSPSGVGQILQHIGDCPYNPQGLEVAGVAKS